MVLTNNQKFILYILGMWHKEANKNFQGEPFKVSISKVLFIDLIKKAKIVEKEERALYKNLEVLEKKYLVMYKNKNLALTERGRKHFLKVNEELVPYMKVVQLLRDKKMAGYSNKKVQTIFSLNAEI